MPPNEIPWTHIADQISRKKCTPIVSNRLILELLFEQQNVAAAWAKKAGYPLADVDNIALVAQYISVTQRDVYRAKADYLHFLRQQLLTRAAQNPAIAPALLDQARRERGLSFSQLAGDRLGLPHSADPHATPLGLLASFDMPIYLTTSPHLFLEGALRGVGKQPHTEMYAWHDGLDEGIPDAFRPDPDFVPTVETPLVYHFHGLDEYPDSLVLTEDDHLEFLENVIHDFREAGKMPNAVRNAISTCILILIGYNVHSWELRTVLQELLRDQPRRPRSVAIQLDPSAMNGVTDRDRFQEFLQLYLAQDRYRFDVYWGDTQSFLAKLWETWQSG